MIIFSLHLCILQYSLYIKWEWFVLLSVDLKELVIFVTIDMFWDPNLLTLGLVVTHLEAYHTSFL
jgi:hypothetical protein